MKQITSQDISAMTKALGPISQTFGWANRACLVRCDGLTIDVAVDGGAVRVQLTKDGIGKSAVFDDTKQAINAIPQMVGELSAATLPKSIKVFDLEVVETFADELAKTNPQFDWGRFISMVHKESLKPYWGRIINALQKESFRP